jgi:hypothetical protein
MTKKPIKSKKAENSRRAARSATIAKVRTTPRAQARDPRLPAPGTTLTREYKGATIRVTVLADGFRHGGKEWRSLSALASELCGNSANGYLWFGLTARGAATSESETAKESERPARPAKRRAPKRSKKIRRAGRDPQPVTPTDAVPEPVQDAVQAAEPATA